MFYIPDNKEEINLKLQDIIKQASNIGQVSNIELIYAIKLTEALCSNVEKKAV